MTIGIFDSGIGGLGVLYEAVQSMPDHNFIFYADTEHVPYGEKSSDEILGFSDHITGFLFDRGADAVLIACNTASACAAKTLRTQYKKPIIAMEPAVKPALKETGEDKRVLVIATLVTIREKKLKDLIYVNHGEEKVDLKPMPQLVRFAERVEFDSAAVDGYLNEQFADLDLNTYAYVVLGCTHFNYFRPAIRRFFSHDTRIIDGNAGTVRRVADLLDISLDCGGNVLTSDELIKHVEFYDSGKQLLKEQKINRLKPYFERLKEVNE